MSRRTSKMTDEAFQDVMRGLEQAAFSRTIGVSLRTLQNWEQGRRRPDGPARVLLAIVDKQPAVVRPLLGVVE